MSLVDFYPTSLANFKILSFPKPIEIAESCKMSSFVMGKILGRFKMQYIHIMRVCSAHVMDLLTQTCI